MRYVLDSEILSHQVQVAPAQNGPAAKVEMADPNNPYHVGAPVSGDLWVMHVSPNDYIKTGEELFNISVMKQEKTVASPMDAMVKRVIKTRITPMTARWYRLRKESSWSNWLPSPRTVRPAGNLWAKNISNSVPTVANRCRFRRERVNGVLGQDDSDRRAWRDKEGRMAKNQNNDTPRQDANASAGQGVALDSVTSLILDRSRHRRHRRRSRNPRRRKEL